MHQLHHGNCLDILPSISDASVDAVICDPPYAEVSRPYGKFTEAAWHELLDAVVVHCKRILKPHGSAMFVLQPNFNKIGSMRLWLWEFLVRTAKDWNLIQNCYWWRINAIPCAGCERHNGLMRNSVKYLLWFGPPNCYRDQSAVLWEPSQATMAISMEDRAIRAGTAGHSVVNAKTKETVLERGGATPFNVIPIGGNNPKIDHPAATPYRLCEWWVRYLTKEGNTVLDPFSGAGTVGLAAKNLGRDYIGIEKDEKFHKVAVDRLR